MAGGERPNGGASSGSVPPPPAADARPPATDAPAAPPRRPALRRVRGDSTAARLRGLLGLLVLSVAATLVAGFFIGRLRPSSLLGVGSRAPAIDLVGPAPERGDVVAQAAGRPLVVEFFESTCTTCQQTAPELCRLLHDHGGILVAAIDAAREGQAQVDGFRRDRLSACLREPALLTLADPCRPLDANPCNNVSDRWRVKYVPTVYVVDGRGRIAYASSGGDAVSGAGPALDRLASVGG